MALRNHSQRVCLLAGLLSSSVASAAFAQSPPEQDSLLNPPATTTGALDEQDQTLGDIVVTATRRSEKLQDVPISVTAISPEIAVQMGLRTVQDIKLASPNTDLGEGVGYIQFYIRGIGANYASPGLEAPVSIYLDNGYVQRTSGMNSLLDLVDPGSIEILRGPQGTLYGRNATGGVVRVSSALPSDQLEGRVAAEYGRFDRKQFDSMLNVPISDTLRVRFAGRYADEDGYINNIFDGSDVYGGRNYTLRGTGRWQPSPDVDISFGAEWQNSKADKDASVLPFGSPICLLCNEAGVGASKGFFEVNQNDPGPYRNRSFRAFLNTLVSLGDFDLTTATSYMNDRSRLASDQDFTPLPEFLYKNLGVGGKTFNQEVQFASNFGGQFNFIAGLNYLSDKAFFGLALLGDEYPTSPSVRNTVHTQSYSAFAEGTFAITPELKVTAGGRYTRDSREATGANNAGFQGFGLPAYFELSPKFNAFTPRFVLAWDNGPTNIFYSYTRGFKAGGINTPATSTFGALVGSEKIYSHEIGWKQKYNPILSSSVSAFYYKRSNLQTQFIDPTSGGSISENAGGSEGYGVEAELTARPISGLTVNASASYLHTEFTSYPRAATACYDPTLAPGAVIFGCTQDLTGSRSARAPRVTAGVNASYTFAIGDWAANLAGITQYKSDFDFFPGAGGDLRADRQKGYVIGNISGYISPPDSGMRLGFYVDNLFDVRYKLFAATNQPYGATFIPAKPITYGLRAEYRF
jgi:iron complex outermembrane receptor protein